MRPICFGVLRHFYDTVMLLRCDIYRSVTTNKIAGNRIFALIIQPSRHNCLWTLAHPLALIWFTCFIVFIFGVGRGFSVITLQS